MNKIVFFETESWEKEYIQKSLSGHDLLFREDKLNTASVSQVQNAEVISPFIYSTLTQSVLVQIPTLKLIATRSTGFDHIDLNYCREKGVIVSNVPTYGEHTVAEHTFGLLLALSRKLIPSIERTKRGDFSIAGLSGFDLFGKTIGIVGVGHIGKRVADLALCFGMNVLACTTHPDNTLMGIQYVSLEHLLSSSDIISLHLSHTEKTHHIINMQNIHSFKKGSILINTARGGLVETQAILEGLDKGILQAVALDVLEEECSLKEERELLTSDFLKTCDVRTQLLNHVLITRDNVIITPHNAFNSREALRQILDTTIENIQSFLQGKPNNIV